MKLKLFMLTNLSYRRSTLEIGPANRKGITTYLANLGHDVTCVIFTSETKRIQRFQAGNIAVVAIPHISLFRNFSVLGKPLSFTLNFFRQTYLTMKVFREGDFNILYVKGVLFGGIVAILIRQIYRVPFVFDSEPLGLPWELYKTSSNRPKLFYYLIAKFIDYLNMRQMKRADLITPSSKWFEESLIRRGIPDYKLMAYPNGIEIDAFLDISGCDIREKYDLSDANVIIYIGTLHKARKLSILIEAFSKVAEHNKNVKLLIVGDGNDKDNLQSLARLLEIEKEVIFTGKVPGVEISKFVAASDIGVSPISPIPCYQVGSPLKVLEYMGGGKPVVANEEIFDQKEVLDQSGGGIYVPFDSKAFADALIELLRNPEKAAKLGLKGRQWVKQNRSYEILARRVEERYLELISTK